MSRLSLVAVALLLACKPTGDDVADTENETVSETNGDGDGDGVCYDVFDEEDSVSVIDCGFTPPCGGAEFVLGDCEVEAVYDPAVGACMLEQLAAGTQGLYDIRDCPGGQYSEVWHLQVFAGKTVLYVNNNFVDKGANGRATWRALPDAAYFQACQSDTPEALIACIEGIPQQECQLGEPSCP